MPFATVRFTFDDVRPRVAFTNVVKLANLAACFLLAACSSTGDAPVDGGGDDTFEASDTAGSGSEVDESGEAGDEVAASDSGGALGDAPDGNVADALLDAVDSRSDATIDATVDGAADADAGSIDETDTDLADSLDEASDADLGDASCAEVSCPSGSVCVAGTCGPCTTDDQCVAVNPKTLCYAGTCLAGSCHPPADSIHCPTPGSACCESGASAGACFSTSGRTSCCDSSTCTGGSTCDATAHTCSCNAPEANTAHVAAFGSDTIGNGSSLCPFKTITKALATVGGASVSVTVLVHASTKTTFGKGCAGGPPCDATPIVVPTSIGNGGVIRGDDLSNVVVTGDGDEVFLINAPAVGLEGMTVVPTKTGKANAGGHAIVIDAASATTEATIMNMVLGGTHASDTVAGTGTGVYYKSSGSTILGPNVSITGGYEGVRIESTANPQLTSGGSTGDLVMSDFGGPCIHVYGPLPSATPAVKVNAVSVGSSPVIMSDCGDGVANGAVLLVDTATNSPASAADNLTISKVSATGTFDGVRLNNFATLGLTNATITGAPGNGVYITGTSKLTTDVVAVKNSGSSGFRLAGASQSTLLRITSTGNKMDGVSCTEKSTTKLRGSTLLSNTENGLFITDTCVADVASTSASDGNIYNKTSLANGLSGYCDVVARASGAFTYATFGCKKAPKGCDASLTPTGGTGTACATKTDYTMTILAPPYAPTFVFYDCCYD